MANDLFRRYLWLMDTFRQYGKVSFSEINRRWVQSDLFDGKTISRRTFFNYREAMERIFNVIIDYDPRTYQYSIIENDSHSRTFAEWMLNSTATTNLLSDSHEIASRIFLEDVPSAREHLALFVNALKSNRTVDFKYHSYSRSVARDIRIEPYFLKIFRQRWYITGRNVRENTIKTYALDRVSDTQLLDIEFSIPENFDADSYCRNSFGIVFNMGEVRHVVLKVDSRQSKYFRDLPLHSSQREMAGNSFSLFYYNIRITPDFVRELLSFGASITVLEPAELRTMVVDELHRSLENYQG